MNAAKKSSFPPEKLKLYDKLAATNPEVERKGATVPYTSVNGHMFSYLNSSGVLALRLPKGEREKFLEKYATTLVEAYGIVQKEYVTVPDVLLANTKELKPYFQMSYEYVKGLKPKPSKKKS
jgi:hypothetical protein